MQKPVILTGIRANAELTLGNYLGAMLPLVRMQQQHEQQYQINMFVPDLHSFTTPTDYKRLYRNTIDNLVMFVASGFSLNSDSTYIYRQSYIPAHAEMTWILDCFLYFGELNRMTQFKDKSDSKDNVSVGLFNYPALMAADILLYGAKYVPVGEDQRQHLELTRDVAIRMNNQFGDLFTVPEPWEEQLKFAQLNKGIRIRSLKHPDTKMSKSISDPSGTILLTDRPDEAADKIMSATTDSVGKINYDFNNQPGIGNLLTILALLNNRPIEDVVKEWNGNTSYGELKRQVAETVSNFLQDFQQKMSQVNKDHLLSVLEKDEAAMNEAANKKLFLVQQAVGIRP